MFSVAIVILNWNGKGDTVKCLESLKNLSYPKVEIFLIDNGSTDGSVELFKKEFPKIRLIETGANLGFAGGNNVGIKIALKEGYDYLFLLNNDTVVDPDIIERFLEGFTELNVGILGAKIYRMDDPKRLDHLGGIWDGKKIDFKHIGYRALDGKEWDEALPLDYVCAAAVMIRREVFEKVGVFDERFFLFWEEADLCQRAKQTGFIVKTCPKAKVWHKISASFTGGKPHGAYFVWRNRLLWLEKNTMGFARFFFFSRLLGFQLPRLILLREMRRMQKLIQKNPTRNQERIIRLDAAIFGMWDYVRGRFGPGSSNKFINCH